MEIQELVNIIILGLSMIIGTLLIIVYPFSKTDKKSYALTLSGFASIAALGIIYFLKINNYPIVLVKTMIYAAMLIPLITYVLSHKYVETSVKTSIASTIGVFAFNILTIITM